MEIQKLEARIRELERENYRLCHTGHSVVSVSVSRYDALLAIEFKLRNFPSLVGRDLVGIVHASHRELVVIADDINTVLSQKAGKA